MRKGLDKAFEKMVGDSGEHKFINLGIIHPNSELQRTCCFSPEEGSGYESHEIAGEDPCLLSGQLAYDVL